VEKYRRAGLATDDNLIRALAVCVLDNVGYIHALRICNYLMLFHVNSVYANAPQSYIYTHIAFSLIARALLFLTAAKFGTVVFVKGVTL
jgi:hypothetical protein